MKKTKKISFITLILLLVTSLIISFAAGCGSYKPPIITDNPYGDEEGTNSPGGNQGGTGTTPPGGEGEEGELIFTVTLYSEGKRFSPNVTFYAQWTSEDRSEIINAPFNKLGVAQTNELDGEYRVTLSGLPDDYTYDPNGIYVDNEHRDVNIELLPIIKTKNNGTNYYGDCIEVEKLGTYRHRFKARDEKVWFRYHPTAQGKYVIESWVDITENELNPVMIWYNGTTQYVNMDYPAGTFDDGGTSSTFSKNFRFQLELSGNMIGNVWIFQLYVDCKGEYPVDVAFTIKLIGDYGGSAEEKYEPVIPQGPYLNINPSGKWTYNYRNNGMKLDSNRFKLNADDGFYHLYDEVTYASSDGWGPVLFAKITKDCEVMNYSENNTDQGGFTNPLVRLKFDGYDYNNFINTYASYCNNAGAHPVTEELRLFLQRYAIRQTLFADGDGMVEVNFGLQATEDDMWLFACGYYL